MPYSAYLVYGYVYNSSGSIVANASLEVITSVSRKYYTTDSDGIYLFDLADNGYISGETITINITEPFNNESKSHQLVISGFFSEQNITLEIRTAAERISDISPMSILHSVGRKPITEDNPLPILDKSDLLKDYVLSGGDDTNRIYGYINKKGAWYIQQYDSANLLYKYVKGANDFLSSWNSRTALTYKFFNEVFG